MSYFRHKMQKILREDKKIVKWRDIQGSTGNFHQLSSESRLEIAQKLAEKTDSYVLEELGKGGWGVVYRIRMAEGGGPDMALKVSMSPAEPMGYTRTRRRKRQIGQKDPELAAILPEIGEIVNILYDYKDDEVFPGKEVRVYGISMELLEPLPDRAKEQLFGMQYMSHEEDRRGFKSKEAESEWTSNLSDPEILLPALRDIYSGFADRNPELYVKFEKEVLNLNPPTSYRNYDDWLKEIKSLAKTFGVKNSIAHSQLHYLKDRLKVPQHPESGPEYFRDPAYPTEEKDLTMVHDFYEKLKDLKNYGLLFWDVKGDNTMMRPSTHEIVIADVGLFQAVEKDQINEKKARDQIELKRWRAMVGLK